MDEQEPPADILGICAMCRKKVRVGSGRMVTYPRLQAVHYLRCELRLRRFLAEAEALAAERMAEDAR